VEGSDLCLPQWETGVMLCMYRLLFDAVLVLIIDLVTMKSFNDAELQTNVETDTKQNGKAVIPLVIYGRKLSGVEFKKCCFNEANAQQF
jgi:hypothetical protein